MEKENKIVIIGAGPAGSSCAISLLKKGFKDVTLINNSKNGKFHIGESIPPDMNYLMKSLGIYQEFLKENHEPCYGSCSYWGSELRGYNDSLLSPYGHGWHLDRTSFNDFLLNLAIDKGANVIQNSTYIESSKKEKGYTVIYRNFSSDKFTLDADFVVDASGSRGVFASDMGSEKIEDESLICLGIRFKNKGNKKVSKLTHLESVKDGWWYAASIPNNYMLVTLYTTPSVVKEKGLQHLKNWFYALADSLKTFDLLSQMEPLDKKVKVFNAYSFCLDKVVGSDWLCVGDTATAYDPITSQGITKAFTHGLRSSEIIESYFEGNNNALNLYQQEILSQYDYYLKSRSYFYELEQRWSESPFWEKMHKLNK